ncbi:MAG: hypothetical protein J5792_05770 [Bacteroidales bacterium]|nr:hypothetical protein [Bacteroidales bacterium]
MKRIVFFICICMISIQMGFSQVSEIGLCLGGSFYLGDLNPSGMFAKTQPAGGMIYRYNFNPRWAFKSTLLFGSLEASDAETNNNDPRGLSFRSPLSELSAQIELNFIQLYNEPGKNYFTPYLFAGISVFSFNPQAKYKDKWYDLQPLGTEGQGLDDHYDLERYSLTGIAIPMGLGFRFNFLYYYSLGFEWGMRKTFTDYIDDVSGVYADHIILNTERSALVEYLADPSGAETGEFHLAGTARGNAQTKDWYSFAVLDFTFKIGQFYSRSCSNMSSATSVNKRRGKK